MCHSSLPFWACRECHHILLGDLDVYTSWASSSAGAWPLAAVPEARSSFLLVLSVAGTHRNASSQNKDAGLHYM